LRYPFLAYKHMAGVGEMDTRPCRGEVEAKVIELHRHSNAFRLKERLLERPDLVRLHVVADPQRFPFSADGKGIICCST
jgi:hypothetical protein